MKKKFLLLAALSAVLTIAGCATSGSNENQFSSFAGEGMPSESDVARFCNSFGLLIVNGSYKTTLAYFDPDYVKEQHDENLGGRTEQFLAEFLFNSLDGKLIPKLNEIKAVKTENIRFNGRREAAATLFITLKNGKSYTTDVTVLIYSKKIMYFLGAFG